MRRLSKLPIGTLFMLALIDGQAHAARHSHVLVEGERVKMTGVIRVVHRGNREFLILQTPEECDAVFTRHEHVTVRNIEVWMEGAYSTLRRLDGKKATIAGKVELDHVATAPYNGVIIEASTVQLTGGAVLRPSVEQAPPSRDLNVSRFYAEFTFAPASPERWTVVTRDQNDRIMTAPERTLACGLNGTGDVINCSCPAGFVLSSTGTIEGTTFHRSTGRPGVAEIAQWPIANPLHHAVRGAVECTREDSRSYQPVF